MPWINLHRPTRGRSGIAVALAFALGAGLTGCVRLGVPPSAPARATVLPARVLAPPEPRPVMRVPAPPAPVVSTPAPEAPVTETVGEVVPPTPAPCGTAPEGPSFREILAAQAVLDRENFSCGCIDGVWGPLSRTALQAWQKKHSLETSGELDEPTLTEMGDPAAVYTRYTVTQQDHDTLAPVPASWREKARLTRLGYETVLEAVAEKYHTSQRALERLNPDVAWPNPDAGRMLAVPDVKEVKPPPAARITISLGVKTVRVYDQGGALIALFPCSIAQREEKRPVGELHVVKCARDPDYTFDPELFAESEEAQTIDGKLRIPPGPNNPVGVAWISLSLPGYGIHGTPRPEEIGKTESHGCFRLSNWNALKLLKMVSIGMPVSVEP